MREEWFVSDPHYNHKSIIRFRNFDGTPTRPPWFYEGTDEAIIAERVRSMNETITENIRKVVRPGDNLYWMGDMFFGDFPRFIQILKSIDARHRLFLGNHDDVKQLVAHFKKIYLWKVFREHGFTCSHIPLQEDSINADFNLHGHLHGNQVRHKDGKLNLRYINNCVELTDYKPRHIDEIKQIIKDRS